MPRGDDLGLASDDILAFQLTSTTFPGAPAFRSFSLSARTPSSSRKALVSNSAGPPCSSDAGCPGCRAATLWCTSNQAGGGGGGRSAQNKAGRAVVPSGRKIAMLAHRCLVDPMVSPILLIEDASRRERLLEPHIAVPNPEHGVYPVLLTKITVLSCARWEMTMPAGGFARRPSPTQIQQRGSQWTHNSVFPTIYAVEGRSPLFQMLNFLP